MEEIYSIYFDTTSLPPNFIKWQQLNIKKELENNKNLKIRNYGKNDEPNYHTDFILLNNYNSVVIESNNSDTIVFEIGGMDYETTNKRVYFVFFPKYHNCYLKINLINDMKIFVPPYDELFEIEEISNIVKIGNKPIFFDKMEDINRPMYKLIMLSDMLSNILPKKKSINKINENKFYYELEQDEKSNKLFDENNFKKKILLLDKYIQNDIFSIYQRINN